MTALNRSLALAALIMTAMAVMVGVVGYFIVFLFAYGFSDGVHPAQHVVFLIGIVAISAFVGLIGSLLTAAMVRRPWRTVVVWSLGVSLALNFAVVAIGSIISATHKDEGSVSADFSTTTDVLVAAGLFAVAALAAGVAHAARPREISDAGRR